MPWLGGFPFAAIRKPAKSTAASSALTFSAHLSRANLAHLFCLLTLLCLSERQNLHRCCPVCRERLTDPLPSAFVAAQVSALDVVCLHDKCRWKGRAVGRPSRYGLSSRARQVFRRRRLWSASSAWGDVQKTPMVCLSPDMPERHASS